MTNKPVLDAALLDAAETFARANKGSAQSCGLARSRNPAGVMPACVAASHGRSIQPCSRLGNESVDA